MKTHHRIVFENARNMCSVDDDSIDLIVTSPPYPMIEMWDEVFVGMNPTIGDKLMKNRGTDAFELMHQELDKVWHECFRVLKPGAIACINIGDAVRTIDHEFQMYVNHSRITTAMQHLGLTPLPDILWRKQTNAPNKFMGSGMLPVGAYVTYEHEYILIFKKGSRRKFVTASEKRNRQESAFFWEERNKWFSDVWMDLKGTGQELVDKSARSRSAAFPFELPYRLICMYSVYGDTVLDPFLGTGTTTAAAMAAGRSSCGVELDRSLLSTIESTTGNCTAMGADRVRNRRRDHLAFVGERTESGGSISNINRNYGFPVISSQESDIVLYLPTGTTRESPDEFTTVYAKAKLDTVDPRRQ
jgi:modification methylase